MRFSKIPGISTILFCNTLLAVLAATTLARGEEKGFTGYWKSTFGHISIEVNGQTATGLYSDGRIKGKINGRVSNDGQLMTGQWMEGGQSGKFVFKLQKGENSFAGRWSKNARVLSGQWIGVRVEKNVVSPPVQTGDLVGTWETNFGKMILQEDGEGKISGTFAGEVNEGTVTGWIDAKKNRFVVHWADQKQRGTAEFKLLSGKSALVGEWWFQQKRYGGTWYGVRRDTPLGCIAGDCETGPGTYVWTEGPRYEGEWQNGAPHGIGKLYKETGALEHSGLWLHGVYQGRLLHFTGNVPDSLPGNSIAKILFPDETVYEGTLTNYEITGQGMMIFPNGDEYRGEVREGLPDGQGTYRFAATGDEYRGRFRKGVPQGRGVYAFAGGDRYDGQFRNGLRHGKGIMHFAGGIRFEGRWQADVPDGGDYLRQSGSEPALPVDSTGASGKWETRPIGQTGVTGAGDTGPQILPVSPVWGEKWRTFLAYEAREQLVAEDEDGLPLQNRKEIYFNLRVVYASPRFDTEAVQRFLQTETGSGGELSIEPIENPRQNIKKVLNRYRYTVYPTKILVSAGRDIEITEENFALFE